MAHRYQQPLQEPHMISSSLSSVMKKTFLVFFTIVTVVDSGFIPPIQERGFMPINHRWQTSLEDRGFGDLNHFEPENREFELGEHSSDLHIHEDHGQHHYEHFEDSEEEHHPVFDAVLHSLPEPSEEYEPKKEKTIHVHEHHHHYHNHFKTIPFSIVKKTVFIKHG